MAVVRLLLAISLLLVTAAFWSASGQGRTTIFEGARLITGDGRAPIENSAFVVQNDQFTRVGRRGEIDAPDLYESTSTGRPSCRRRWIRTDISDTRT